MEEFCLECSQLAPFICTIKESAAHPISLNTQGCLRGELTPPSSKPISPRSPLSKASARGGLRSFSRDSSWGLASSISRSSAGLSRP